MSKKHIEKMRNSISDFGGNGVNEIRLEDFNVYTLFLDRLDLDTHLVIQSGAIAWYGYQYQRAITDVGYVEKDYNRWKTQKLAEAEAQLMAKDQKSPTIEQKSNRFYANCDEERKRTGEDPDMKWREKIQEAEETARLWKFWLDGFSTKNYLMKQYSGIRDKELNAVSVIKEKPTRPHGSMGRL